MAVNILQTVLIMWQEPLFYTSFSTSKSYFHQTDLTNIITVIFKTTTTTAEQSERLTGSRRGVQTPANQSADRVASHPLLHLSLSLTNIQYVGHHHYECCRQFIN